MKITITKDGQEHTFDTEVHSVQRYRIVGHKLENDYVAVELEPLFYMGRYKSDPRPFRILCAPENSSKYPLGSVLITAFFLEP